MIRITCDTCGKQHDSLSQMITFSTQDNLCYKNPIEGDGRSIIEINTREGLHFCNKKCFVGYFFREEDNNINQPKYEES